MPRFADAACVYVLEEPLTSGTRGGPPAGNPGSLLEGGTYRTRSSAPASAYPANRLPDGEVPASGLPDGAPPDGAPPDGGLPDGRLPDGGAADGPVARRGRHGARVVVRRLGAGFAENGRQVAADAFPAGEVVAFDSGSPGGRCVTETAPVLFGPPDSRAFALAASRPGGPGLMPRLSSMLAVPMAARGTTVGMLVFARTAAAAGFEDGDAAAVAGLAERTATCIADALQLTRQRTAAEALQRVLAPREPAVPPGIEVEGRCLAAHGHVIGGDWYDIISLPGPRTGLIVGDVMDHGPEAAALMAQLRAAAHALADVDLEPAELLRRLDRMAHTLPTVSYATCTYAVLDAAQGSCVVASAGPLPPVLALPGGVTRVPRLRSGLPLGLGVAIYAQTRFTVAPGAVLALYTDGLVESRQRTADEGILALRSALCRPRGSLADACDTLIDSLAGGREDDTTLVLARIPAGTHAPFPAPVML